MFKNRKSRRTRGPTEAVAQQNMEANRKNFAYPTLGFVAPIEHSLLYSMISESTLFPHPVVVEHIRQEDFDQYLYVISKHRATTTSQQQQQQQQQDGEEVSYAQLTAIVALAADKWPAEDEKDENERQNIPQILYKAVLQCVVRYAEAHELDRESEVHELLQPLEEMALRRTNNHSLAVVLPYYLGITASVMTANPLPMVLGSYATCAVAFGSFNKQSKQNSIVGSLGKETRRKADVETTSLLDEVEE